jgi:hypothetical protein
LHKNKKENGDKGIVFMNGTLMKSMKLRLLTSYTLLLFTAIFLNGCSVLRDSSKYGFSDGTYKTRQFAHGKVYVLKIDEDTIAVFPVLQFKDSSAIIVKRRINYCSAQKKLKDNKASCTFYKPSLDVDAMTIPLKYRPGVNALPNQLATNFNGAIYGGYRIDAYKLRYAHTPLNTYKQNIKHSGYSLGLFAGLGSTLIDATSLADPNYPLQYEGVLLLTGITTNFAVNNLSFGVAVGEDHLLDKNHYNWIYQGNLWLGLTVGININ